MPTARPAGFKLSSSREVPPHAVSAHRAPPSAALLGAFHKHTGFKPRDLDWGKRIPAGAMSIIKRRRKTRWGLSARTICGLRMMCASITVTLPASQSSAVLEKGFAISGDGRDGVMACSIGPGIDDLRLKSIPLFPKKKKKKKKSTMMLYYVRMSPGEVTYNHTSGGVASVIRVHLFQSQRLPLSFATIAPSHLHTYQPICPLHLFYTCHIQSSPASVTSSSISVTTLIRILSAQIPRQIQQQNQIQISISSYN